MSPSRLIKDCILRQQHLFSASPVPNKSLYLTKAGSVPCEGIFGLVLDLYQYKHSKIPRIEYVISICVFMSEKHRVIPFCVIILEDEFIE